MPTYDLYAEADLAFSGNLFSGYTVTLASDYDGANDVSLEIIDDDDVLDGDFSRNEDGNDTNQYGIATFPDGTIVGSATTTAYSEQQYTLTAPDGTTITLYQIEVDSDPSSILGDGILVGYLPSAPLTPGVTYSLTVTNTTGSNAPDYEDIEGAVCLTRTTKVLTERGPVAIEDIRKGDLIETSEGLKPVRWIGSRVFTSEALAKAENLRPVRVSAGVLGGGLPRRDLLVSRQHRMVISSKIAKRMFGEDEILIPAIRLTEFPGIFIDHTVTHVEYFHMLFDAHEIIYAEGAPTESLFTGPQAMKSIPSEMRDEIFYIFPELQERTYSPELCRCVPPPKQQKKCVARHIKNNKAFLE